MQYTILYYKYKYITINNYNDIILSVRQLNSIHCIEPIVDVVDQLLFIVISIECHMRTLGQYKTRERERKM